MRLRHRRMSWLMSFPVELFSHLKMMRTNNRVSERSPLATSWIRALFWRAPEAWKSGDLILSALRERFTWLRNWWNLVMCRGMMPPPRKFDAHIARIDFAAGVVLDFRLVQSLCKPVSISDVVPRECDPVLSRPPWFCRSVLMSLLNTRSWRATAWIWFVIHCNDGFIL